MDHKPLASSKSIDTLVEDIYGLFKPDSDVSIPSDVVEAFGQRLARHLLHRLAEERKRPSLRLSTIGNPCNRKLWYSIRVPELGEQLAPSTRIKFLFGDILEELLLFLAEAAGHTVTGQQDELEINGVKGHRDAIVDGRLIDCKSASSFSFRKFKTNGLRDDDPFGYLDQLGAYHAASVGSVDPDVASFLVIDKQHGHITLDTYPVEGTDYQKKVEEQKAVIALPEPPPRAFSDVPEGKSGNRKLDTQCSYCGFKATCWPNLRTFIYSSGPVYLTKVEREPKVPEVTQSTEF